jgi:hypothetical protein
MKLDVKKRREVYKRGGGGVVTLHFELPDLSCLPDSACARLSAFYERLYTEQRVCARRGAKEGSVRGLYTYTSAELLCDVLSVVRRCEYIGDATREKTFTDLFKIKGDGRVMALKYSKNQRLFHHGTDKNGIFENQNETWEDKREKLL